MQDFTQFICFALRSAMRKVDKYLSQGMEKYGVNMPQTFVLFCLLENNGSTLTEISLRAEIENSSLTSIVDKLEYEQLVERRADSANRRIVRVFLTDKGRTVAEDIMEIGIVFNRFLEKSIEGNKDLFVTCLKNISDSLVQAEECRKGKE